MKEYVIWGIPEGARQETLLLARVNGEFITDENEAKSLAHFLEIEKNCTKVRIQTIDGTMPDFAKTVNI